MAKNLPGGVRIYPESPAPLDTINISYNGLLPSSGATAVYAHFTFDSNWNRANDTKMTRLVLRARTDENDRTFLTSIKVPSHAKSLDFCFYDAADNWDNNYGQNYSIGIR